MPTRKAPEQLWLAGQAGKAVESAIRPEGTARYPIFLELCPFALRPVLRARDSETMPYCFRNADHTSSIPGEKIMKSRKLNPPPTNPQLAHKD